MIERGVAKLLRTDQQGKEVIIGLRFSGDLLGAAGAMIYKAAPVSALTSTQCLLYRLPLDVFYRLIETEIDFLRVVAVGVSWQFYEQTEQLARLGTIPARNRLAQLLLRFVSAAEPSQDGEHRLALPCNQSALAQLLAVDPAYLSRLFRQMEQDGVIRRGKRAIYVTNLDLLEQESK